MCTRIAIKGHFQDGSGFRGILAVERVPSKATVSCPLVNSAERAKWWAIHPGPHSLLWMRTPYLFRKDISLY